MADITNPQAIKFSNEKARVIADLLEKTFRTCDQFMLDIVGEFEGNTGGNANDDVLIDGAASDGRGVLTKLDIGALKFVVEKIQEAANVSDRRAVVAKVSVNGQPAF